MFAVGEQNNAILTEVSVKTAQRAEQEKLNGENTTAKERKETERNTLYEEFQKICWAKSKAIRKEFPSIQEGFKRPISKFVDHLLQLSNPVQHDIGELRTLYKTAFDPKAATYREFQQTGTTVRLRGTRGNELLGKSITSSSETLFSAFIKAINATNWVRQGHEHYTETADGKCPTSLKRTSPLALTDNKTDIDDLRVFQEAPA